MINCWMIGSHDQLMDVATDSGLISLSETTDFYSNYPGYDEFFALHGPPPPPPSSAAAAAAAAAAVDSLAFIPSHPSSMATVSEAIVIEQVPASKSNQMISRRCH